MYRAHVCTTHVERATALHAHNMREGVSVVMERFEISFASIVAYCELLNRIIDAEIQKLDCINAL